MRRGDLPFTVLLTRIGLPVSRKKFWCQRFSGKTKLFPVKHRLHTIGRENMMSLASNEMCPIAQVSKTDEKTEETEKRSRVHPPHGPASACEMLLGANPIL